MLIRFNKSQFEFIWDQKFYFNKFQSLIKHITGVKSEF